MKKILILFVFTFFFNCAKFSNTYSGYIYDYETKIPLKNVFVTENFKENAKTTYSDEQGYFKIINKSEFTTDLIFKLKYYKTDTIVTVWSQHGEKIKYRFIGKNSDTLYMRRINPIALICRQTIARKFFPCPQRVSTKTVKLNIGYRREQIILSPYDTNYFNYANEGNRLDRKRHNQK